MNAGYPKYSILYCGYDLSEEHQCIGEMLSKGIKVLWFGNESDVSMLNEEYGCYIRGHLLYAFVCGCNSSFIITDGKIDGKEDFLATLSKDVECFNYEQYLIEHSQCHDIVVTASAGTGKTTVMMDRLMYLLHTREIDMSRVVMITFTNEATNQMMERIQKIVITRYELTHNPDYLRMMEKLSSIRISTIDSFSYSVIRRIGSILGYSRDVSIKSNALVKNDAISSILDNHYIRGKPVKECFGANLFDVFSLIKDFNSRLSSMGITGEQLLNMDWGRTEGRDSEKMQEIIMAALSQMDESLIEWRTDGNVLDLTDIVHDLDSAISCYGDALPDLFVDYLFVDEFQDTNDDQIKLISNLARATGAELFIVGDPKQSIYRFRGADDFAFDTLESYLPVQRTSRLGHYQLIDNYRTDCSVMNQLNVLFKSWVKVGYLADFEPLMPCLGDLGGEFIIKSVAKDRVPRELVRDLKKALSGVKTSGVEQGGSGKKVVVLVRSNYQLDTVARICDENNIPMITRRDMPLYKSDAVRDLFALLSSYVHVGDPTYMFDYLNTPYSCLTETIDSQEIMMMNGSQARVGDYLSNLMEGTPWYNYAEKFRDVPALSVIRNILDDIPVVDNYVARIKGSGVTDETVISIKAERYRLNLDKVMMILHDLFSGDGLDLPHIYDFMKTSIATNRDEMEADPDYEHQDVAYCMTVHKAKGLEFDTVIIPFNKRVMDRQASEVLMSQDRRKIGWIFYDDKPDNTRVLKNSNYTTVHEEDLERSRCEETRILYVAMTRAIRNLTVYTQYTKPGEYSWSNLIEGRI